MARIAGLRLRDRWGDWRGAPFTAESRSHVSVWEKPSTRIIQALGPCARWLASLDRRRWRATIGRVAVHSRDRLREQLLQVIHQGGGGRDFAATTAT
jgi:hypothetical protein